MLALFFASAKKAHLFAKQKAAAFVHQTACQGKVRRPE